MVAADLGRGEGWGEAADGVAGIIHMATPLGTQGAQDLATMTEIARAGTLRVLKAAVDAGVPRVVMTSSGETATLNKDNEHAASSLNDESKWTDVDRPGIDPYPVSKTLAEQAAWAFIREQGGAAQGMGYALYEDFRLEQGRILTPDLTTYLIPTASDLPDILSLAVEGCEESGPHGLKGVGEVGLNGPAPAIASAVEQAVGVRPRELPMTPERVLKLLSGRGRRA